MYVLYSSFWVSAQSGIRLSVRFGRTAVAAVESKKSVLILRQESDDRHQTREGGGQQYEVGTTLEPPPLSPILKMLGVQKYSWQFRWLLPPAHVFPPTGYKSRARQSYEGYVHLRVPYTYIYINLKTF